MSEAHSDKPRQENPVVRPVDADVQPDGSGALGRIAELLPCPFCGNSDVNVSRFSHVVECWKCGAKGPLWDDPREWDDSERRNWNRRAWQPANTAVCDDHAPSNTGKPA